MIHSTVYHRPNIVRYIVQKCEIKSFNQNEFPFKISNYIVNSEWLKSPQSEEILSILIKQSDLIKLSTVDYRGNDLLMHAVKLNNYNLVNLLIDNKDKGLLLKHKNSKGHTIINKIMSPKYFGTPSNI